MSLPSNNLHQRPVFRPELRVNPGPDVSATQSQSNQSVGHQTQRTNCGTYNAMQTAQTIQANEAQPPVHSKIINSLIYKLLCSDSKKEANVQQSIAHQNTGPQQSEVCATDRTDHNSVEQFQPPNKSMKHGVDQRGYWDKDRSLSKDRTDLGMQSDVPRTLQTTIDENRLKIMNQHNIHYSTDPADCLEAVIALQRAAQQGHKAIAIVPPISQQPLTNAQIVDTTPKKPDSPPLKIASVWSLGDKSDAQKSISESPSHTPQQDDKSIENDTESSTELDTSSVSTVECQNDVQQGTSDLSKPSFDLSSVPVVEYNLEKLRDLVNTLERTEFSERLPEHSEFVLDRILKIYWNGNEDSIWEPLGSLINESPQSFEGIVRDVESVVFESVETENLQKLVNCNILKSGMYSSSEEFRSSWLNIDGQPADIEGVLSEALADDITVYNMTSENTDVTSPDIDVNYLKYLPEISTSEKSVKLSTCNQADLSTPLAGSDKEATASENNGHSYVVSSPSKMQMQNDTDQSHTLNTNGSGLSPLAESLTEKPTNNKSQSFKQDHSKQLCDNVFVSQSLSDDVSDGVKSSEKCLSTETLCRAMDICQVRDISDNEKPDNTKTLNNSSETWPVEDISEDENSGNKDVPPNATDTWIVEDISEDENSGSKDLPLNTIDTLVVEDISEDENCGNKKVPPNATDTWIVEDISDDDSGNKIVSLKATDTWLVEDISEDEHSGNKQVPPNASNAWVVEDISDNIHCGNIKVLPDASDIWQVEDISDNENSGDKEVPPNASEIWQVEDISDDENSADKDTLSDSSDICIVEDVSNDENSSDDPMSMELTVLSFEDANTIFHHIEDEPECAIKAKSDCPNLAACSDVPNHEYYKTTICSLCSSNIVSSNSTDSIKTNHGGDGQLCLQCWEQAPLLELEDEPDILGSPAKSNDQSEDNLKHKKPNVDAPVTCIAEEGLTIPKRDSVVKSQLGENCCQPSQVKKPTVPLLEECAELKQKPSPPSPKPESKNSTLGLTEQCIELKQKCMPISVESEVKKPTVASKEQSNELTPTHSLLFRELVKKPAVVSTEECNALEGLTGPGRDHMVNSELGQRHRLPSTDFNAQESTCASPGTSIAEEQMTVQKSNFMETLQLKQNRNEPCLTLQGSSTASAVQHGLVLQKFGNMAKGVTKTLPKTPKSAKRESNKKKLKIKMTFPKRKKPPSTPSASSKHNPKSASPSTVPDECVLFAPDIVVKKICPQKKNVPAVPATKRPSVECNKMNKSKERRPEIKDINSLTQTESIQKRIEKGSEDSNTSPIHRSGNEFELHGILTVNKTKATVPKKVRFDLFGSKTEEQSYAKERRFSAPATLTVSDSCNDYTDVLSAKQKVHNLWSSTFIPQKKNFYNRSQQEGTPQKNKTLKHYEHLKSNMSALKDHLTQRAMLLSNSEVQSSHFRKPFSRQKLSKTLSS
nr:uncharacterized protein LOC110438472 [Danio rerio]|eukprot:XP_021326632.1 uncharacterized protein LOC110438472 [Danio rerio]